MSYENSLRTNKSAVAQGQGFREPNSWNGMRIGLCMDRIPKGYMNVFCWHIIFETRVKRAMWVNLNISFLSIRVSCVHPVITTNICVNPTAPFCFWPFQRGIGINVNEWSFRKHCGQWWQNHHFFFAAMSFKHLKVDKIICLFRKLVVLSTRPELFFTPDQEAF